MFNHLCVFFKHIALDSKDPASYLWQRAPFIPHINEETENLI